MTQLRRRLKLSARGVTMLIVVLILLAQGRVRATNDENHIQEIMAGANGDARIQFIVIKTEGSGNLWGPQPGETQSRVMLVFQDALGRETGKFKFPGNPTSNPGFVGPVLIATQDFANLPGAPTPNFILPRPMLNAIGGRVCFSDNPQNPNRFTRFDCVSYGNFTGATGTSDTGVAFGSPAPALPIMNTVSLKRSAGTLATNGSLPSSNYVLNAVPTPANVAGATFTIPVASQVTQGASIFTNETFGGNGRSCATCHVAGQSLRMPPSNILSRFATLATTFDPLFIGELAPSAFDAGFDFNLNTLDLTAAVASNAPCSGELRGIITTPNSGRAKVLGRVSGTRYLIQGGANPAMSAGLVVSDSFSCSATVSSFTAGDLARTEASGVDAASRARGG